MLTRWHRYLKEQWSNHLLFRIIWWIHYLQPWRFDNWENWNILRWSEVYEKRIDLDRKLKHRRQNKSWLSYHVGRERSPSRNDPWRNSWFIRTKEIRNQRKYIWKHFIDEGYWRKSRNLNGGWYSLVHRSNDSQRKPLILLYRFRTCAELSKSRSLEAFASNWY